MGLSNEDRRIEIYNTIHDMVQRSRTLPNRDIWHENYRPLKGMCDRLWHAFLGDTHNGTHWLLGSSATQKIGQANSPWAVALQHHFQSGGKDDFEERMEEREDAEDDAFDAAPDKEVLNNPRAERGFQEDITIEHLLEHANGGDLSEVYYIYAGTEQLVYALRRYNDDFLDSYSDLSKLVSDIQGECFSLFQETDDYAQAYLLNQILTLMFKHDNPVRPFAFQQDWSDMLGRSLNLCGVNLAQLKKWHLDALRAKSVTDWMVLAISIMGRRYHYPDKVDQLFRMANKRKIKLDTKRIREAFAQCVASHAERDADRHHQEMQEYMHLTSIHGYEVAQGIVHGRGPEANKGTDTTEDDDPTVG